MISNMALSAPPGSLNHNPGAAGGAAVNSTDRSLSGLLSGASGMAALGVNGSASMNGSGPMVPFFYNPNRGHPNFNPTKPVVVLNRNLVSLLSTA